MFYLFVLLTSVLLQQKEESENHKATSRCRRGYFSEHRSIERHVPLALHFTLLGAFPNLSKRRELFAIEMRCFICNISDSNDDSFINCDSCSRALHKKCSGLNASELRVMDLKNKRTLKFHCDDCVNGLLMVPKLLKSIDELRMDVEKLKTDVINITASKDTSSVSPELTSDVFMNELQDRQKRINNLILFNMENNNSDKKDVENLLETVAGRPVEVRSVERIGKPNKNNRKATKVVLADCKDVHMLTKNRYKLKNTKVYLNLDLTKQQRNAELAVKNELAKRLEDGEKDLIIRYSQGKPTICSKNDRP